MAFTEIWRNFSEFDLEHFGSLLGGRRTLSPVRPFVLHAQASYLTFCVLFLAGFGRPALSVGPSGPSRTDIPRYESGGPRTTDRQIPPNAGGGTGLGGRADGLAGSWAD